MPLPRLILTGASGFLGRRLLDGLKETYEIFGIGRRSQTRCGAPHHENIHWYQIDIGDREPLFAVFDEIHDIGPADYIVHLAAHYDFTGEDHPEYYRTNVEGLRNVLEASRRHRPRRFVFSSSVAACQFPPPGQVLTEKSPPDGDHLYAETKAIGERMLAEYSEFFPSVIVRFAALFSDWCEYPPLYMFLRTWLSNAWNNRILGGQGQSAIPYLHVKDAAQFLRRVLARNDDIEDQEILVASTDGAITHRQLFMASTQYYFDEERHPLYVPRPLVWPGIKVRCMFGAFLQERPFERPWMARYVDKQLTVDASHTRARLHWAPRTRLELLRRLPFLLEHLKTDRVEWTRRNRDAMKQVHMRPNLKIHYLLEKHRDAISLECTDALRRKYDSYQKVDEKEHLWNHRLILRHLFNSVRTRERVDFLSYCRELAERRMEQGFSSAELVGALETLDGICLKTLMADSEAQDLLPYLYDHITMTIRFGIDQVQEVFEESTLDQDSAAGPTPI